MKIAGDRRLDLERPVFAGFHRLAGAELQRSGPALAALLDLANAPEQILFDLLEVVVGDLARLALHLGGEQLLAQRGVVVHLRFGRRDDGPQRPRDAADHQVVEDKHERVNFQLPTTNLQEEYLGSW